ncbi:Pentatricopeptide repeat-containing protein [Spatholobus suberectus]|nr:Pentatricopeptide repeat-containing protein [Spatholobus suberectus]
MLNYLPRLRCISFLHSFPRLSNNIKQIHAQLITNGLKSPTFLAKLIEHYCGSLDQHIANNAHLVFQYFDKPDLFLFNTLIRCVQPRDSILIFQNEFSRGLMFFDDYTYNFVLGACACFPSASTLWVGRQLHALIVKHGVESNILVPTTKIYFYASNKDIISA